MKVYVASPFGGEEENLEYARLCLADSIDRGEVPFAPHLLYPQVLDDSDEEDRGTGMELAREWIDSCDLLVLYVDRGVSDGMVAEAEEANLLGIPVEHRNLWGRTL